MNFGSDGVIEGKWLFIGGAGFIGSHVVRDFQKAGAECFVLDNMSTGIESRLPSGVLLIRGDATDTATITKVCKDFQITGIVHLAAFMQARESVRNPIKFWTNNLGAALGVANSLANTSVRHLIFSSSCSVYGNVRGATTESPLRPISPYAFTKVASEQVLTQSCDENNIRLSILRYFNVIGCGDFASSFDHSDETLLSASAKNILSGRAPIIFGSDLSTPDGTAMRDYVDVRDLVSAHRIVAASGQKRQIEVFNVSRGIPVSVKTILTLLLAVSGSALKPKFVSGQAGDPEEVWAIPSSELIELGWSPKYDAETSIRDFWDAFSTGNE